MTDPRWLLLAHQLPTRPSNARVKTWRRLQQVGAVPTRNSVYVLPNTEQCREDFEWIRSEIVALGGEATVFAATALDDGDDMVEAFQHVRDAEYRVLQREVDELVQAARSRKQRKPGRISVRRGVRSLREKLSALERIDFFHAPGRAAVENAFASLERLVGSEPEQNNGMSNHHLSVVDFQNRRWATRPRPGVDRMASAWLIRRFIDPNATFAFVEEPSTNDVAFDMYVGDFTHDGPFCTFETLSHRFGLTDRVVGHLGQIVHDLDMKDARYEPPEALAIGRLVEGLQQLHPEDHVLLDHGIAMFEALARSFDTEDRQSPKRHPRPRKPTNRRKRTPR